MMTLDDIFALKQFTEKYPTWWWKIGHCDLTRDFDCGPQAHSPEMALSKRPGDIWDTGFSCDYNGSISGAIKVVMVMIDYEKTKVPTKSRLNTCPTCGGPADNGHDRSLPPDVYECTKCEKIK